jgi:hypothetical protein
LFDELSRIAPAHLEFNAEYLIIFVPTSIKTDIYRDGKHVYIKRLSSKYCPVKLLERYISLINTEMTSALPVFRALTFSRLSNAHKLRGKAISYTSCLEIFKGCLVSIGYDPKCYGLHSLRSGGATAVANNDSEGRISDRLIKLHGRWKTDIAKDMYIHDDVKRRLELSTKLGL